MQPDAVSKLLRLYRLIRDTMTEGELAWAIRTGAIDRLLSDEALEAPLAEFRQWLDVETLRSADAWAKHLPHSLRGTFGYLNPFVVDAVRGLDRAVTTRIAAEVRETVRQAVEDGLVAGEGPRTTARRIREQIGLSPRQARAVERFRGELVTGDRAALSRVLGRGTIRLPDGSTITREHHAGGRGLGKRDLAMLNRTLGDKPLTPDQVGRMVEAYRKRLLALNTEGHARSIALDANRLAQRLSWEDAIERGIVVRSRLRRTWLAVAGPAGDGRNRPEHLALHGTMVGFDDRYPNGQLVPGETDYNCRCVERITVAAARMAA
jgi:hypothetical protein